jgi:hypothetical protein
VELRLSGRPGEAENVWRVVILPTTLWASTGSGTASVTANHVDAVASSEERDFIDSTPSGLMAG